MRFFRGSKFRNVPTLAADGKVRQSRKEAENASRLEAAKNAGMVTDLESQKTYRLDIYGQAEVERLLRAIENGEIFYDELMTQVAHIRESRIHITSYVADHVFQEKGQKRPTVADTKGRLSGAPFQLFQLKAKLMRVCHNIDVEVWI